MPNPVNLHALNARLCSAMGVDPSVNAGFRLTVLGGHLPVLERFELPTQAERDRIEAETPGRLVESTIHRYVLIPRDGLEHGTDPTLSEAAALNTHLCDAVGLDVQKVAGFRLTILGEEHPALEAFMLPPSVANTWSDEWALALEWRARDVFRVVEAASMEALEAVDNLDYEPVGEDVTEPIPERHAVPAARTSGGQLSQSFKDELSAAGIDPSRVSVQGDVTFTKGTPPE
jgi:hypothetical protein